MKSTASHDRMDQLLRVVMITLILFKLWLVGAQAICVIAESPHDDRLFLNMTAKIINGHWLGNYSQMTLIKGPFFSLFASAAFVLGIPLFTAQHLLYALACGAVLRALRPLGLGFFLRAGLFAALLFNPVTYDTGAHSRLLRQNLTPALSLLILAGLIALHVRRKEPKRRLIPWALLLGAAMSAFSLTREDGVWSAPALLLPWAATVWLLWREHGKDRLAKLGIVVAGPLSVYVLGILTICTLNWNYYGLFTTCELRHPAFKAAYGSLTRVTPARWHPYIPVARETRERIYAVSPAFAELRPELEGLLGLNWAANSQALLGLPPEDHEIGGGWFMWALRDAVTHTGHARTGAEAMAFYARIAREVNTACDLGLIEAGPSRSGFLPPWDRRYNDHLLTSLRHASAKLLWFDGLQVTPKPSSGSPERLVLFADLTHERLAPTEGERSPLIRQATLDRIRLSILDPIREAYSTVMPWLGIGAFLCALVGSIRTLCARHLPYWGLLSAGMLGSCLALILICALVDTTLFPAVRPIYLTGGYGILIFSVFTGFWTAFQQPDTSPAAD